MSALPSALPLALSASLYPPALLVLVLLMTGDHPRRLVLAYFIGAALMVVSAGLIALAVINTSGATAQSSSTASGWVDIALGVGLFVPRTSPRAATRPPARSPPCWSAPLP